MYLGLFIDAWRLFFFSLVCDDDTGFHGFLCVWQWVFGTSSSPWYFLLVLFAWQDTEDERLVFPFFFFLSFFFRVQGILLKAANSMSMI